MMLYKEIKLKTVYSAKSSRMTRALETMQSRKVGIISLSTREKADRQILLLLLSQRRGVPLTNYNSIAQPVDYNLLCWVTQKAIPVPILRTYVLGTKYDFTMPLSWHKFGKLMQRRKADFYNNLRLIKHVNVYTIQHSFFPGYLIPPTTFH